MGLTAAQRNQIVEALLDAFPTPADLAQMLRLHFDAHLAHVTTPGPLAHVVTELVGWAEAQGKLPALIAAARLANPGNPQLQAVANWDLALDRPGAPGGPYLCMAPDLPPGFVERPAE